MNSLSFRTFCITILVYLSAMPVDAQTYEEEYNLGFQVVNKTLLGWIFDANNSQIRYETDTTNSTRSIKFSQTEIWGFREKLNMVVYSSRRILLPPEIGSSWKVVVSHKNQNLKDARVIAYFLNMQEKIIKTDTIILNDASDFTADSIQLNVSDARFLFLSIKALGKDSTYTEYPIMPVNKTVAQALWIQHIRLYADNVAVNTFPVYDEPAFQVDSSKCFIPTPAPQLTDSIQFPFPNARIVALGETVHGSRKLNQVSCNLIKQGIEKNQVSLILFENPLLQMLYVNRYVQGSNLFSPEMLELIFDTSLFESEPFLELVRWIREYNQSSVQKVQFLGLETRFELNGLNLFLKGYLQTINRVAHSNTLEMMIPFLEKSGFEKSKENAKKILSILENRQDELTAILGDDLPIISFYLRYSLSIDSLPINRYYERDKEMAEVASFLIDSIGKPNKKTLINCHLMHANYLATNIPFHKSLGFYLKARYNNDYNCIAQMVYQDTVLVSGKTQLERNQLPLPSANSLEGTCNRLGYKYCFLPTDNSDEIVKIRIQGSALLPPHEMEGFINLKSRISGVLFVN